MPKHKLVFEAIGTHWSIETTVILDEQIEGAILRRVATFDKTYSRFRKDSLVSRIARRPGIYTFPEDMERLFSFYEQLYEVTDEKVTLLIGGMLEKAGYDAEYSFVPSRQQTMPKIEDVMVRNGIVLEVKSPVVIDVGAAGKGYLVDLVCGILDSFEIDEYVVDASGDLRHKGIQRNTVGLEHPLDVSKIIGMIDVQNSSFCASATNRRQWANGQHHIFDPTLMAPTREIIATWVMADTAMVADGLATALFFTDPMRLRELCAYDYVRMHGDGSIDYSPAFKGKLF